MGFWGNRTACKIISCTSCLGYFSSRNQKSAEKGKSRLKIMRFLKWSGQTVLQGWSILTGVHKNLNPVFISGGEENIEV